MTKITMYTDFAWPFCYIGKGVVESFKEEFDYTMEIIPCESKADTPAEGKSIKSSNIAINLVLKQIMSSAKKYDLEFNEMEFEANSKNALLAQVYANEVGLSHEFSNATYKAFFGESKNISLQEVVLEIASSLGMDTEKVSIAMNSSEYHELLNKNMEIAKKNGIKKFPTFVFNDEHVLTGSPNEKKLRKLFESIA